MADTLKAFGYVRCKRADCGVLRQYLTKVICAVERISEAYLLPVLAAMMAAFPFVIRGFHSDNGSEYINRLVAKLLKKMLIIPQAFANQVNAFAIEALTPYLNYHRPCRPPRYAPPHRIHGHEGADMQAPSFSRHDDTLREIPLTARCGRLP